VWTTSGVPDDRTAFIQYGSLGLETSGVRQCSVDEQVSFRLQDRGGAVWVTGSCRQRHRSSANEFAFAFGGRVCDWGRARAVV
jgi:hypothetical protein